MNWETAQLLIAPGLTVLFQAAKRIKWVLAHEDYIPLASLVAGAVATVAWTLTQPGGGGAALFEAFFRGLVYGAGAVGLYELLKPADA